LLFQRNKKYNEDAFLLTSECMYILLQLSFVTVKSVHDLSENIR